MQLQPQSRLDRFAAWVVGWTDGQAGRFTLWLPIFTMAGDAWYFALAHEPPIWLGSGLMAIGFGVAAIRRVPTRVVGLPILFAGIGFAAAQLATARAAPFVALPTHAAAVTGRIVQIEALPNGERLLLDRIAIDGAGIGPRRLRIQADATDTLSPGETVALRAMVAPPSPPAYPGGWDLQRDAYFSQLAGYGTTLGDVVATSPPTHAWLATLRAHIGDRVRARLPGAPGAIAATLLTGSAAAIPAPDRVAFRDAGLSHLLAIAGLHIGIVMGIALVATRALLLRSERIGLFWPVRTLAAIAALVAGLGYLLLTGMHVPILRSFVMAGLVVLALLVGRQAASLRNWGFAAVAVLVLQPEQITGPSFQLSFAAVLALIAGYEALRTPLTRLRGASPMRRLLHRIATLALTSLLAGGASTPFIAYHFGTIQLYFIVANMIAVPLTAFWVMPAGLLSLVLMPLGLDRLVLPVMGWGIAALLWIARSVAHWPAATLRVADVTLMSLLPMACGLAWLCLWRGRTRAVGIAPILLGLAIWLLTRPPDLLVSADGQLIGLRTPTTLYLHAGKRADSYVADQWSRHLGRSTAALPDCDGAGCRLPPPATGVVFGRFSFSCAATVLVLSSGADAPACPGSVTLDRGDTWQQGAWAIWLGADPGRTPIALVSDRDSRGDRPWVFLPPEQQRRRIDLPMAMTESLPAPP